MSDKALTFQQAYDELQGITQTFENGELDLEKSIPQFKRAAVLVKFLKSRLIEIQNQIEEIDTSLADTVPAATASSTLEIEMETEEEE